MLSRTRSREDERVVIVELTEQGRELQAKARIFPSASWVPVAGQWNNCATCRQNCRFYAATCKTACKARAATRAASKNISLKINRLDLYRGLFAFALKIYLAHKIFER